MDLPYRSAVLALALAAAAAARAQELEPRAYSPSPVGTNFAVVALGNSKGSVDFDAGSPISDAKADFNLATVGYSRIFGVAGHQASAAVAFPYAWGDASGNVGATARSITRAGMGDARVKVSAFLLGGPALTPQEFRAYKPGPVLGVSLSMIAPTGQYHPDKLINLGANRWAFKPEIGVSYPFGKWQADAYAGVWLFTDNDDFLGQTRGRDPLGTYQAHLSYTFRPALWAALDATYYVGGSAIMGGVRSGRSANARVGLTLSVPVAKRQSLVFGVSQGALTRVGGDFTTIGVSWRTLWFE